MSSSEIVRRVDKEGAEVAAGCAGVLTSVFVSGALTCSAGFSLATFFSTLASKSCWGTGFSTGLGFSVSFGFNASTLGSTFGSGGLGAGGLGVGAGLGWGGVGVGCALG